MKYILREVVGEIWVGLYARSGQDTVVEIGGIVARQGDEICVKKRAARRVEEEVTVPARGCCKIRFLMETKGVDIEEIRKDVEMIA